MEPSPQPALVIESQQAPLPRVDTNLGSNAGTPFLATFMAEKYVDDVY